jgi:hypothetical protein
MKSHSKISHYFFMSPILTSTITYLTTLPVLVFLALLTTVIGFMSSGVIGYTLFAVVLTAFAVMVSARLTVRSYLNTGSLEVVPSIKAEEPTKLPTAPLTIRPDLFPATIVVDERPLVTFSDPNVPVNLPVAGFATVAEADATEALNDAEDDLARALEAQAHAANALLSTDALRHLLATLPAGADATKLLTNVINNAKKRYPSEDGWIVINESRMREVCLECLDVPMAASSEAPYVPTIVPAGTGSLAEMIAAGNLGAAYSLIGPRPMFALADAVADFDALYRRRRGEETTISNLLEEASANFSDETIKAITVALTSALDGTYTDEAEAVKTAIMKAVKVAG